MDSWYSRWNNKFPTYLWILVIVAILATLPLIINRVRMESSSKKVEFVFNYRSLLDISDYKVNPREFVDAQLMELKKAGVPSLAVFESTLNELRTSRRIMLYNAHDAAALMQTIPTANDNSTYVLFTERDSQTKLQSMIEQAFQQINVKTKPWVYKNQPGLIIEMPLDEAILRSMDPDPFSMQMLKDKGFQVVVRLSNRRPYDAQSMNTLLAQLTTQFGIKSLIVDGDEVPGFAHDGLSTADIKSFAELMNTHQMMLAIIEPLNLKAPQKGIATLAKHLHYNSFRLHSFSEQDADKLTDNLTIQDLDNRIKAVSDRFVLAVKDRNIRMVFLNARPLKSLAKGSYDDPLKAIYASLKGEEGAITRIKSAGFTSGVAHGFLKEPVKWESILKLLTILGSVALIAMFISYFIPSALLSAFIVGAVGALGLNVIAQPLLNTVLSLSVAVCSASLAMMTAIQTIRRKQALHDAQSNLAFTLFLFIRTVVISGIGAIFLVGLLSDITYSLVINQFKGVSILAFTPFVIVLVFVHFFSEGLNNKGKIAKAKRLLTSHISVLWILIFGVAVGAGLYLLTRTGNAGQASSLEMMFRSFLEDSLNVRPRTKEFLIGHPLFILGVFLCVKYRLNALYVVVIGAIGQASIVGTFTHLHTTLYISIIRVSLGLGLGIFIGLVFIGVWELCARSWGKWLQIDKA